MGRVPAGLLCLQKAAAWVRAAQSSGTGGAGVFVNSVISDDRSTSPFFEGNTGIGYHKLLFESPKR